MTLSDQYLQPFSSVRGNRKAKVLGIGEAWGREEDLVGVPFVGQAGQELNRMMKGAGFDHSDILLTNVLNLRPPGNKFEAVLVPKAAVGKDYKLPALASGKYMPWDLLPHVARLWKEIWALDPNLIICFGGKAAWAVLGMPKIGSIRGAIAQSQKLPPHLFDSQEYQTHSTNRRYKVLPTYHPSAVLRNWSLRVITLADLMKAERERLFPEIVRPTRWILVDPTIEEVEAWTEQTLANPPPIMGVDIETKARQIEMIGFGRARDSGMVVPFWGPHDGSYWPTADLEVRARICCRRLMDSEIPKVFQNGIYDIQYCWCEGMPPRNCTEDTMLRHHSMYPEMPKGLGFLGSIYTNEASWKLMRQEETTKRDE